MLRHDGWKATQRRRDFSLIAQRLQERRHEASTRQDLPIKRPRNSMKTIRVGTADPAEKATIQSHRTAKAPRPTERLRCHVPLAERFFGDRSPSFRSDIPDGAPAPSDRGSLRSGEGRNSIVSASSFRLYSPLNFLSSLPQKAKIYPETRCKVSSLVTP